MIVPQHIAYFDEIFSMEGFLADPILTFGYQEILRPEKRWPFQTVARCDLSCAVSK
jgi:hypothetical protein